MIQSELGEIEGVVVGVGVAVASVGVGGVTGVTVTRLIEARLFRRISWRTVYINKGKTIKKAKPNKTRGFLYLAKISSFFWSGVSIGWMSEVITSTDGS